MNEEFENEFNDFVESYNDEEHKQRLKEKFIEVEVVDPKKEKPMQACRVATMGRLSELKLVNWTIEKPNGWSKYELTPKGEECLSYLINST